MNTEQMYEWIDNNYDFFAPEQIATLDCLLGINGNNKKTYDDWAYYWYGMTFEQVIEDVERGY